MYVKAIRRFTIRTVLPENLASLGDLASNLRWSWHESTRNLFRDIDPRMWKELDEDPVRMLAQLSPEHLRALSDDEQFVNKLSLEAADLADYLGADLWYEKNYVDGPSSIAYFSPEYGITHVLPQYSGGLGILAGDHLKSASDLGIPIIGVGLLYKSGYFRQALTAEGWQTESYPIADPDDLPLTLLREDDGTPVEIKIALPEGRQLVAHVWRADVGRVRLLLLDSDVPANDEKARMITDRLYGGGGEYRLQQEILLGIGGVRALRVWSRISGAPAPEVFHTNEGHAGFLGLERIRELLNDGLSFDEAFEAVRGATVFTTHTPVPAGIDKFGIDLIESYLGSSGALDPVPVERVLALGAEDYPGGQAGLFNMAVMGLRMAGRANGVSLLHGSVSREMFTGLWPGFDGDEVPITSITNGVHAPTWVHPEVLALGEKHVGQKLVNQAKGWNAIDDIPAEEIWSVRRTMRQELVTYARQQVKESWIHRGAAPGELAWTDEILDPDVLTIGFARRVPTYKRLTLMLRDPARLKSLLLHPERPIQLLIAGKSHPADEQGKRLIQQMVRFADDPEVRHRIVFLPNYDMHMARHLYPGCDVWLNNPLRPLEACGTSGMKAALNGCLNLSVLDGWWDEWYDGENGWAIPTADGVIDPDRRDDLEAQGLYDLIERSVAPRFYDLDDRGLPVRWLDMVRHTLSTLGPKVLATRMVSDYTEQLYLPAARSGAVLNESDHDAAKHLAGWKTWIRSRWSTVRVDHVESSGIGDSPEVGQVLTVKAYVSLGDIAASDVRVQLVHGRVNSADMITDKHLHELKHVEEYEGGRHRFEGALTLGRTGNFGYTVRVLPHDDLLVSGAEMGLVASP